MNKIKKLLIILIILLIIIVILIVASKKNIENYEYNEEFDLDNLGTKNEVTEWSIVKDNAVFFTAENCINEYLADLLQEKKSEVFSLLDEYYIKNNNITKENVLEECKIDVEDKEKEFQADKMYFNSNNKLYVIYAERVY